MSAGPPRLARLVPLADCGAEVDQLLLEGQTDPLLGPMSLLDRSTFPSSSGVTPNYALAWPEGGHPWGVLWGAPDHLWPSTANIGLFVAPSVRSGSHGLRRAAALAEAIVFFGRELLTAGFSRIEVEVEGVNVPMLRFLRRMGVRHEGTLRENSYLGGRLVDTHLFAFDAAGFEALVRANWRRGRDRVAAR